MKKRTFINVKSNPTTTHTWEKEFNRVAERGDWNALKRLNPTDFTGIKRKFIEEYNSKRRDLMSTGMRTGMIELGQEAPAPGDNVTVSVKPVAYRHRYCTDDYLRPVDGESAAIAYVSLHEELRDKGISLMPYGDATKPWKVGDQCRISIPMHMLTDKLGEVTGTRRNEFLVKCGSTSIWLTADEMGVV